MNRKKWLVTLLAAFVLCVFSLWFLYATGFFREAVSVEGLQKYILKFTPYSHVVFFLLQLLSVILAPIPSNISAAAGGILFGTWISFGLTAGAVLLGSVTVFLLGRSLGKPFADRFVSRKVSQKYLDVIRSKQDAFLVLAFLFPFFPDDVICILAGLTEISFVRFLVIAVLTRPWGLLFASALGGASLDMPWWGMGLIGVLGAALFLIGLKYGDRAEEWVLNKIKRA